MGEREKGVPVNHDFGRQLSLFESGCRGQDVLGFVVGTRVGASKNDMARRVSIRLDDCEIQKGVSCLPPSTNPLFEREKKTTYLPKSPV